MKPSILRNLIAFLALSLLTALVVAADQGIPINAVFSKSEVSSMSGNVTVYVFDAQDATLPLTAQTYFPGEWSFHPEGEDMVRLKLRFTDTSWLSPAQALWGEFEVDGTAVGERISLRMSGPSINADGEIKTGAGFVFPDDSVQTTAGITTESDPTVDSSLKDGVSWSEVSARPAGLDDGDDVGITTESDPTVTSSVKDGVSWTEVMARPAGLDDGDQVGITAEADPTVLASVKDGVDWSELTGVPSILVDGHSLDAADGTPVDVVYVDNDGNVGIGTSVPIAKLEVDNGDAYIQGIGSFDAPGEAATLYLGDAFNFISVLHGEGVRIGSGVGLLSVNFFGNVGIGNTAPPGRLSINSSATDGAGSYADGVVFTNNSYVPEDGAWTHAAIWTDGRNGFNGELVFGTDDDGSRNTSGIRERMRINKNGFVGIGTSDPQTALDVNDVGRFNFDPASNTKEVLIATPGGEPGIIAFSSGGKRRDIVFDDTGIRLRSSPDGTPPGSSKELLVTPDGVASVEVLEIRGGADVAERFHVNSSRRGIGPVPGMVVSIDPANPGALVISDKSYDRRVAGVISGAEGINPGMLLGQQGTLAYGSSPVALSGRVNTLVDAANGPIEPGDLLTSSDTPGYAMKVTDYPQAQGAIIGKAMTGHKEGKGVVLTLVTLQ